MLIDSLSEFIKHVSKQTYDTLAGTEIPVPEELGGDIRPDNFEEDNNDSDNSEDI